MSELTKATDDPKTDSECPWCGATMRQGGEVRYCERCPFSAQYFAQMELNDPAIIWAFAEWKENHLLTNIERDQ